MQVQVGKLNFEVESLGDESHPPIVLVMGFSMQLIAWEKDFCDMLIKRGFRVIRFDNRDIGLSDRIDAKQPNITKLALLRGLARESEAAYSITDMAEDTIGIMDALDLQQAHIVGISMGGMIAQRMAINHPQRLLSLTSLMSTTGQWRYSFPKWPMLKLMLQQPGDSQQERLEYGIKFWNTVASPADPPSKADILHLLNESFHRAPDLSGRARQLAAIMTEPSRHRLLGGISTPTLVIHGDADPLIRTSAGIATAKRIPGAQLEIIRGMGHDLRPMFKPTIAHLIADHADQQQSQ